MILFNIGLTIITGCIGVSVLAIKPEELNVEVVGIYFSIVSLCFAANFVKSVKEL